MDDALLAARDRFHQSLGYCIAEWANVDHHLFLICWTALRREVRQAAIIYCRTPTLESRITLTRDLVESHFVWLKRPGAHKPRALKQWARVEQAIREELQIRSRLAHSPTGEAAQWPDRPMISEWEVFELYPSDAEIVRGKHQKSLKERDLVAHLQRVRKLPDMILDFHSELEKHVPEPARR